MAARPRAKTAETKVTGPAFYLGIWQSCVALAMLWPEAALVSRETQGMLKLAGGLVMSFFRQLPPVIQTQLSPFYGKRLFFAKLAEIAYQYVLQEKKLTAPSLPSPDVLKEAMAKVKSATEEAIKEGRRILPPHAEIFDAAKGKIAKPLLQKYPSLPPEMVEYLAWNLSLSFLPRAVLSNKAIDALTPVIEAAFQQAGIAIPPGEQAQSLATELIKELNPEIEDYKKVPVGEMVIAGQARVLPPEAVPPPPAAEVISQAIRRANPDLVQPEKIEQIEFLARQAFREIRGRPPTELTFYLRQKVLEILPGVTPAQARKIAREAIGAVAVQESASVVPTEINVLTGGKSFPVPLTLTKPKEKGVLTAYDEARKRVKNLIEKNAAIGKVLASSPAFVDNFAFLLPEVSRTEVKSLPPDKVVPDAQDACALAAASLAITNPELEISFAAIKKMIKDVVVTQEDVSAIKEMMIIPAQARVSPAERRPIPKEVPLGQVHGGQPPSLFGFISRIVSETMRQNPLRAFRQPDELARKIKAILTTKGLNSRTALPIRRFLAEGISRFLGSQGVKPADINETLARANLGKEHPLFRFYKDVEPLLGEFQKRLSWFKSQLGTILPLLRKPVFPAPVGIKGGLWQSFWEGLQVGFWRTNISRFVRDEAGEIYIYNRPLGFVSSLSQPVFRSLASWFSKTALGKSINLGWRNLRQAGLNFLLQVGKSGLGQAV
ncbi:hypothetical protein FJZ40_05230, partial [Candidatus Shapirobacteria bacterium]|nr:hypothetical protein [Candidatus Shapirobacteria bacterium]